MEHQHPYSPFERLFRNEIATSGIHLLMLLPSGGSSGGGNAPFLRQLLNVERQMEQYSSMSATVHNRLTEIAKTPLLLSSIPALSISRLLAGFLICDFFTTNSPVTPA